MAVKNTAMTQLKGWVSEALSLEETKRGLGRKFHAAVMSLLDENPGKTNEELGQLFKETMAELANVMTKELGGKPLNEALPSFKQYFSDYKRGLELMGYDIRKCGGIADVKSKKTEILEAMKDKESGGSSNGKAAGGGDSTSANNTASELDGYAGLPPTVKEKLAHIVTGVAQLPESDALSILNKTESIVFGNLKNGNRRMMMGTSNNSDKGGKVAVTH